MRIERGLPLTYDVHVSYEDARGEQYAEPTKLDLAMYVGTGGITRNDLHDIHKRLEQLVNEVKKWTAVGGGLKTMSPDDIKRRSSQLDELRSERENEGANYQDTTSPSQ